MFLAAWLLLPLALPIDVNPGDDLKAVLSALQPGDEVIIHAGTYGPMGFTDFQWNGQEQLPIVVRGADGESVVIAGDSSQNTLNVRGTYWSLRNLEISGGSHGVRIGTSAHATVEDLHIHDLDDVGISCNLPGSTYEDLQIRRVHIHHTGTGGAGPGECMYLGCNDDGCQVWNSLVEFNWCHDTTMGTQGDGIELKTGSYGNTIRHNVIHDVNYPGITMYGTVGGKARNIVEGNVIWNVVDNGIQTVGDVIVRNNLVFSAGGNGIHAKPSQGEIVSSADFLHNTVVNGAGTCFRANNLPDGTGVVIANNAFYCTGGTAMLLPEGAGSAQFSANAVVGDASSVPSGTFDGTSRGAAFVDAAALDVYPADASPLRDAGDATHTVEEDFNCLARDPVSSDVGAYGWTQTGNPGWVVAPGFKECAAGGGGSSGGSGGSAGSSGGTSAGTSGGSSGTSTSSGGSAGASGSTGASSGASGPGSGTGSGSSAAGESDGGGGGCGCHQPAPAPRVPLALVVPAVLGLRCRRRSRRGRRARARRSGDPGAT